MSTKEERAEWLKKKHDGMISAIGEYVPPEFWHLLQEVETLESALAESRQEVERLHGELAVSNAGIEQMESYARQADAYLKEVERLRYVLANAAGKLDVGVDRYEVIGDIEKAIHPTQPAEGRKP